MRIKLTLAVAAACAVVGAANAKPVSVSAVPPSQLTAKPLNVAKIDGRIIAKTIELNYLTKIGDNWIALCKTKAVGCQFAAIGPHGAMVQRAAGDARRAPDSSPRKMSATDRLTIASVSKVWTGSAMLHLMHEKGVGLDDKVATWLPKHWTLSAKAKTLTFRQLMTHKSGLECGGIDYVTLRNCFKTTDLSGAKTYHNENFAIFRVVIPTMQGMSDKTLEGPVKAEQAGDATWMAVSFASLYREYVNKHVFAVAGLPTLDCQPGPSPTLSYESSDDSHPLDFTTVKPGEIWGDMREVCGSQGWWMSVTDMAKAYRAVMTPGLILDQGSLDEIKNNGVMLFTDTFDGGLAAWGHNGWHPYNYGSNAGEVVTEVVYLSNGVVISLLVNSYYPGSPGGAKADLKTAVMLANK